MPSPANQLRLAAPKAPLTLPQLSDLRYYLNFVPEAKRGFLQNILGGGLGFEDKRPLLIDAPQPRVIPSSTERQMIAPRPPTAPVRVIGYELERDSATKSLTLVQVGTNGSRTAVTLQQARTDSPANLEILRRAHPNNFAEFQHGQELPKVLNNRKKRKANDPDFVYDGN